MSNQWPHNLQPPITWQLNELIGRKLSARCQQCWWTVSRNLPTSIVTMNSLATLGLDRVHVLFLHESMTSYIAQTPTPVELATLTHMTNAQVLPHYTEGLEFKMQMQQQDPGKQKDHRGHMSPKHAEVNRCIVNRCIVALRKLVVDMSQSFFFFWSLLIMCLTE